MDTMKHYVTMPTKIAMVCYVILLVIIMVPARRKNDDEYDFNTRLIAALSLLAPMIVSLFLLNCVSQGSTKGGMMCTVLAWINAFILLAFTLMVSGIVVYNCILNKCVI